MTYYLTALGSSLLDSKISGGTRAVPRIFKFMASLKIDKLHFCGGCLISKKHILTAGQCIHIIKVQGGENFAKITILLGTNKLSGSGIICKAKDVEHHPDFDNSNLMETSAFDIGVILVSIGN